MSKKKNSVPLYAPTIFPVFKPARISSFDVVRHFKRHLPQGYGKIGHFGTLDPFASGLLMIGIAGAARLNELVHSELTKTYLAVGKLGVMTETGDLTIDVQEQDKSSYLQQTIRQFEASFIEKQLQQKFVGEYWQAPHRYSAAKFEGRKLHEWAREGVEVKKAQKKRHIYQLEVVKYAFPYLSLRVEVSSGTYIRSLFQECAEYLGTYGCLVSLVREKVGGITIENSLKKAQWPQGETDYPHQFGIAPSKVLPFPETKFDMIQTKKFLNGLPYKSVHDYEWVKAQSGELLGLSFQGKPKIVFQRAQSQLSTADNH